MKNMIRLGRILRIDIQKAIFSSKFLLAVLGIVIINLINLKDYIEIDLGVTVCYLFNIRDITGGFAMIMLFLVTVPYAASFCVDYTSDNYKFQIIRSSTLSYSVGKIVTTVSIAIVTSILGYIVLAVFLGFFIPIFPTNDLALSVVYGSERAELVDLLLGKYKWMYLLSVTLAESLQYGFLAGIALYTSTLSNNKFIIFSSPIIFYYAWSSLYNTDILPQICGWHILDGVFLEGRGAGINVSLTIIYYMILIILVGIAFVKGVKRRVVNG